MRAPGPSAAHAAQKVEFAAQPGGYGVVVHICAGRSPNVPRRRLNRLSAKRAPSPTPSVWHDVVYGGKILVAHSWPKRRLDDWLNHAETGQLVS